MTSAETISFYTTGRMPERFRGNFETDQAEILRARGVRIDTQIDGGFYYGNEDK